MLSWSGIFCWEWCGLNFTRTHTLGVSHAPLAPCIASREEVYFTVLIGSHQYIYLYRHFIIWISNVQTFQAFPFTDGIKWIDCHVCSHSGQDRASLTRSFLFPSPTWPREKYYRTTCIGTTDSSVAHDHRVVFLMCEPQLLQKPFRDIRIGRVWIKKQHLTGFNLL